MRPASSAAHKLHERLDKQQAKIDGQEKEIRGQEKEIRGQGKEMREGRKKMRQRFDNLKQSIDGKRWRNRLSNTAPRTQMEGAEPSRDHDGEHVCVQVEMTDAEFMHVNPSSTKAAE